MLECVVPRPPQTEVEAVKMAVDQWIFCEYIACPGTRSILAQVIEIWKSLTWCFGEIEGV